MNNIVKLRRIMRRANYIRHNSAVLFKGAQVNQAQALHYSWYFERDFRKLLHEAPQRFYYFKKDGSLREARGTLDLSLIPADKHPKGSTPDTPNTVSENCPFTYFDLDKAAWRSFHIDDFVGFVEEAGKEAWD